MGFIRERINRFKYLLPKQIKCSRGQILLGRETGPGKAQEITIGAGLTLTDGTLTASGGSSAWADITGKPTTLSGYGITDASAVLTRTAEEGAPVANPTSIIVSGAGSAVLNGIYNEDGTFSGKPKYTKDGDPTIRIIWNGLYWLIQRADAISENNPDPAYSSNENVATPDLVTTWSIDAGASAPAPSVSFIEGVVGTCVGQLCRVGNSSPYAWHRWDGSAWEEI